MSLHPLPVPGPCSSHIASPLCACLAHFKEPSAQNANAEIKFTYLRHFKALSLTLVCAELYFGDATTLCALPRMAGLRAKPERRRKSGRLQCTARCRRCVERNEKLNAVAIGTDRALKQWPGRRPRLCLASRTSLKWTRTPNSGKARGAAPNM